MQELHRGQQQFFGMSAFRLDFDKQRVRLVHSLGGEFMRGSAYRTEKPLLCRQEGIMCNLPPCERVSDFIAVHPSNVGATAVLVNMIGRRARDICRKLLTCNTTLATD